MYESARLKAAKVNGPFGPLTIADRLSPGTRRWSIRRKATVIAAVRGGLLSLEEACGRYALNVEQYVSWQYRIGCYGLAGLRTTRTQFYLINGERQRSPRRSSTNHERRIVFALATRSQEPAANPINTGHGARFAVVRPGRELTEHASSGSGSNPSGDTSTNSLCMDGECCSDVNMAWFESRTIMCVSGET